VSALEAALAPRTLETAPLSYRVVLGGIDRVAQHPDLADLATARIPSVGSPQGRRGASTGSPASGPQAPTR
jgi:hypothetical protein